MRHLGIVIATVFASQLILSAAPMPKPPSVGDTFAFSAALGANQPLCDQTVCLSTLGAITVPAGAYTITAKLVISSWNSTAEGLSFCYLYAGTNMLDASAASTPGTSSYAVPMSLQAASSFSGSQTVELKCSNNNNGAAPANVETSAQNWKLIATKIGTLTQQ